MMYNDQRQVIFNQRYILVDKILMRPLTVSYEIKKFVDYKLDFESSKSKNI